MNILGLTVSGLVALILFLIGLVGLFGRKGLGQSVRGMLGMIPIGNPKLWAAILLIVGIAAGGAAFGWSYVSSGLSGVTTATGLGATEGLSVQDAAVSCRFVSAPTSATAPGVTARADTSDLTNYYADVIYTNGTNSINGTILCKSDRADIRQGVKSTCYAKADAFRSQTSTTDSNTYYILATSTTPSVVPGMTWQQTAYLADSGGTATAATTSSQKESIDLVFAQDETEQYLGFYLTLPGSTVFGYLNNQTSSQVHIICDDEEVSTVTVVKVSS